MASTTIAYQRANGLFAVSSSRGTKRVTEQALRSIGDMDIAELVEKCIRDPYTEFTLPPSRTRLSPRIA